MEHTINKYNKNSEEARTRYYKYSQIGDKIVEKTRIIMWLILYYLTIGLQYSAYFCKNIHIGFFYMFLSELKVMGIYFAYKIQTDYILTEDIISEFDKKKHILKKNKEIKL